MSIFLVQFGELFTVSFFAGAVGSLLGLGGGVIVVPVMTLFLHLDFRTAAGASIIAVIATSSGSAAAYVRDRLANIRVGMFLEIFTALGAISGALLVGRLSGSILYVIFALVLLYSLVPTIRKIARDLRGRSRDRAESRPRRADRIAAALSLDGSYFDPARGATVEYSLRRVPFGAAIMYVAGLASGLLGIGSGVFKVLAMDSVMGMPIKSSTATSNFMIGVTAAASAGIYFSRGDIDPFVAAPVALGVLAGSLLGARILPRIAGVGIRIGFLVVIATIGMQMLLRGLGVGK
jgi:Predicted permeases